jgi:hypothetical protein
MIVSQTSRPDIEAVTALIGYVGRLEAQQTELQQAVDSLSADPIYEE